MIIIEIGKFTILIILGEKTNVFVKLKLNVQ